MKKLNAGMAVMIMALTVGASNTHARSLINETDSIDVSHIGVGALAPHLVDHKAIDHEVIDHELIAEKIVHKDAVHVDACSREIVHFEHSHINHSRVNVGAVEGEDIIGIIAGEHSPAGIASVIVGRSIHATSAIVLH